MLSGVEYDVILGTLYDDLGSLILSVLDFFCSSCSCFFFYLF